MRDLIGRITHGVVIHVCIVFSTNPACSNALTVSPDNYFEKMELIVDNGWISDVYIEFVSLSTLTNVFSIPKGYYLLYHHG